MRPRGQIFNLSEGPIRPSGSGLPDLLRCVIDDLPDGVIVADAHGALLLFNQAAERILDSGLKQIDPSCWSETYGCFLLDGTTPFPSEDLPLARALRGEEVRDVEMLIRNPRVIDGATIVANAYPLLGPTDRLDGGVVVFRDVTETRRATELSRRLSSAVEQTADGVLITDRSGTIIFVNPAFEQLSGYPRDELVGRNPSLLRSGEHSADFYRKLWESILAGNVFRATMINRRKDGARYWCQQTITPMKEPDGTITHFVAVLKDMTEHRALEEHVFQMRLAQAVQRNYYTVEIDVPGYDIAGGAFPARQTGGDYYDFIPLSDGDVGLAIGDVTGHGFGSALLMAELRTALRLLSRQYRDVADVMAHLNQMMYEDLDEGRMATLLFLRLDPRTGRFVYASAGHSPGHVLDPATGVSSKLAATGLPLGSFQESTYTASGPHTLAPGSLLLLLTDGLTETMPDDEVEFGANGALRELQTHHDRSADEIIAAIHEAARQYAAGCTQADDITMIVCKALSLRERRS